VAKNANIRKDPKIRVEKRGRTQIFVLSETRGGDRAAILAESIPETQKYATNIKGS